MIDPKIILIDTDGVLLNWRDTFDAWMMRQGIYAKGDVRQYDQTVRYGIDQEKVTHLIQMFNQSANIGYLPPLYDSYKYVRKLFEEHGYKFLVVSSLSKDPYAQKLRTKNLQMIFGEEVFEDFIYLDTGADKTEVLKELAKVYPRTYWIEDKVGNAKIGNELGFDSILVAHPHIKTEDTGSIPIMKNWKEVYEYIIGETWI
tara:strand:+ start:2090 stop:2692 length:603 start_codon:yes stop_codon:yes gene_type:complete